MDFLQQVAKDRAQITSSDFATAILFTPPAGPAKTVPGYASRHAMDVNEIGFLAVNAKKAVVSVSEINMLKAPAYVTRDDDGSPLNFTGHLISWTDASGFNKQYIVQKGGSKWDENVGTITFTLGDYKPA